MNRCKHLRLFIQPGAMTTTYGCKLDAGHISEFDDCDEWCKKYEVAHV